RIDLAPGVRLRGAERDRRDDLRALLQLHRRPGRRQADAGELGRGDGRKLGDSLAREIAEQAVDERARSEIRDGLFHLPNARLAVGLRPAGDDDGARALREGETRDLGGWGFEKGPGFGLLARGRWGSGGGPPPR